MAYREMIASLRFQLRAAAQRRVLCGEEPEEDRPLRPVHRDVSLEQFLCRAKCYRRVATWDEKAGQLLSFRVARRLHVELI